MDKGAPTNYMYSIVQGDDGFLYVGTDKGLYKFDGSDFYHITNQELGKTDILRLQKDERGGIWGMTFGNHLIKVSQDSLEIILQSSLNPNKLMDYVIQDHNNIWLSSENDTLYKFIVSEKKYHKIPLETTISDAISGGSRLTAPTGILGSRLYFKRQGVFYKYNDAYIDLKNYKTTFLSTKEKSLVHNRVFNTGRDTFLVFSPHSRLKQNLFQIIQDSIHVPIKKEFRFSGKIFEVFSEADTTYLCTNNSIIRMDNDDKEEWSNVGGITDIVTDKYSRMWATSLSMGLYYSPNTQLRFFALPEYLSDNNYRRLLYKNGKIFIGTENGNVLQFDVEQNKLKMFFISENRHYIYDIYYHEEQKGISFNAEKNNKGKNHVYIFSEEGSSPLIKKFPPFSWQSNLHWKNLNLGFHGNGAALYFFQEEGEEEKLSPLIPRYLKNKIDKRKKFRKNVKYYSLNKERTYDAVINKRDTSYWIASRNNLYHFHLDSIDTILYNGTPIISSSIELLDDGSLWAASQNGIYHIVGDSVVEKIDATNGLRYANINRLRIFGDELFLCNDEGLQCYNTTTKEFRFYNILDGLPTNNVNDVEVVREYMYIGTDVGLVRLPKRAKAINKIKPRVFIKKVAINNKNLDDIPKELDISYNENNILLEFGAVSIASRGEYSFKYRLLGVDSTWIESSSSNNIVRFLGLSSREYVLEVKALNEDGVESETKIIPIRISPPFWKTWWFILLSVIALALLIGSAIYIRFQIINERLKLEKALKQSEMKAIKAQMNPHFTFNALNSIQSLVLQKKYTQSNHYLGKFSNLVRTILLFSEKETISLSEEVEVLQLYLDLEKLRFENIEIEFTVDIEPHIQKELGIPPMLIQPYIENAFKHGILHKKKGEKRVTIHFYTSEDYLYVEIKDNGVGRKQRKKMQERSLKMHRSYSTEANQKRISILNQNRERKICTDIEDLHPEQTDTGTFVLLSFPIQYDDE